MHMVHIDHHIRREVTRRLLLRSFSFFLLPWYMTSIFNLQAYAAKWHGQRNFQIAPHYPKIVAMLYLTVASGTRFRLQTVLPYIIHTQKICRFRWTRTQSTLDLNITSKSIRMDDNTNTDYNLLRTCIRYCEYIIVLPQWYRTTTMTYRTTC
jgi:hypothetical protein